MQYNMFNGNIIQLATLPTITFIYPNTNISPIVDFQYNFHHSLHQIPIFYQPQPQPNITTDSQFLPKAPSLKNKIKKPRTRNQKKELQSAKKNSESNLVNQLYSFFSNYQKSQGVVQKAIKNLNRESSQIQKIKGIFYNTVRLINFKRGRKYVNKESVLAYYTPQGCMLNIEGIQEHLNTLKLITIDDFCYIFRLSTHYFFKEVSLSAVLTSKRISSVARGEHLKRRRRVLQSLHQHTTQ